KFELDFLKGLPECESCETTFSFGANGEIIYNTQTGTTDIYVNGHEVVRNAYSEVATGGETFTSMDYTSRTITEEEISDDFGAGKKITVNMTADGLPNMQQIFY